MLLRLKEIQKSFGGVPALRAGNLEVAEGEVHLLMGENGAGKSTLMKIAAGMQTFDSGEMLWRGESVSFATPAEAAMAGIAMVHQESLLAGHLTIAENIFLGHESFSSYGWVDRRGIVERARQLMAEHGFRLDPQMRVSRLSPAGKQLVEICRALAKNPSLLILDEPTSSLSNAETAEVFRIVKQLCERKVGVIYITHRLEELRSVGDHVTVLRDGATVHSGPLHELSREKLIQHMVGRSVDAICHRSAVTPGDVLLRARNVCQGTLRDVSFELRAGEIVGLAGLMGAGRSRLCKVLFGLLPAESGGVEIAGETVTAKNPRQAVLAGVALIPEDRQVNGLALQMPIGFNLTMPDLGKVSRYGVVSAAKENALTEDYRRKLQIKCQSTKQLAGRLSGGNQQKIVIAKWVARGARIFLFDEPTRGIDVAAKQEVFEEMDRLAKAGGAILMVSSELPELLQVADRILVMANGRIAGELPGKTTQEEIMRLATPGRLAMAETA